jgi:hypothetical protein
MSEINWSELDPGKTTTKIEFVPSGTSKNEHSKEQLLASQDENGDVPMVGPDGVIRKISVKDIPEGKSVLVSGKIDPDSDLAKAIFDQVYATNSDFKEQIDRHRAEKNK